MKINKLTIEEISEGTTFEIERSISEDKINQFAQLSGDYHPLHTDSEYAKKNGFKSILAHGLLISSFSSALIGMEIPGENAIVLSQSFNYKRPAYIGDTLKIKGIVSSIDKRFSTINVKIKISNQDMKIVAKGDYLVQVREPAK